MRWASAREGEVIIPFMRYPSIPETSKTTTSDTRSISWVCRLLMPFTAQPMQCLFGKHSNKLFAPATYLEYSLFLHCEIFILLVDSAHGKAIIDHLTQLLGKSESI